MPVKAWAVLKTTQADVQPANLTENEVKLFGLSSQQSNAKRIYFRADASIVEGLRAYYGGVLYEVRGGNAWDIHGVVLAIPVIGETYSAPAPVVLYFGPLSGAIGASVTIYGTSFVGVTGVTFNGTAATAYTVTDSATITATVPTGATTGKIAVAASAGTGTSVEDFTVTP
jgi:hypothetical protein